MDVVQHKCTDLDKTACKLTARKLVNISLQQRLASIKFLTLKGKGDFGEGCHSASTEPYFYEAAVQKDTPIPVNEYGQCIVAEKIRNGVNASPFQKVK